MDRQPSIRQIGAFMDIRLGLTFDDVLLVPAESEVLPSEANTSEGTREPSQGSESEGGSE